MSFRLQQTRRFARAYKKLHDNVAVDVDEAVGVIVKDPSVGERKKAIWRSYLFTCFEVNISFICSAIPSTKKYPWSISKQLVRTKIFIATSSAPGCAGGN